jgi:hypothetical protein
VVSNRAPDLRRILAMDFLREHANGIVSRGTLPPLKPPFWRFRSGSRLRIFNFTRRNPHNMDGVADHVGGARLWDLGELRILPGSGAVLLDEKL